MSYPNTINLGLKIPNWADVSKNDYASDVGLDQQLSSSLVIIDEYCYGLTTAADSTHVGLVSLTNQTKSGSWNVTGAVSASNMASGQAPVTASAVSVVVTDANCYAASPVVATLGTNDVGCWGVKNVVTSAGSFIIRLNSPMSGSGVINWIRYG